MKQAHSHLAAGRWKAAIDAARDGLEIDPFSRPLDRYMTQAFERWGEEELAAGKFGSAAVVYRAGLDEDPRDPAALLAGLSVANQRERQVCFALHLLFCVANLS